MLVASTSVFGVHCTTPAASSWRTPPSRPRASPCVGVWSSWCPKASVRIPRCPTGTVAARLQHGGDQPCDLGSTRIEQSKVRRDHCHSL